MSVPSLSALWKLVSRRCNNFLLPESSRPSCSKFILDGYYVGLIRPDTLSSLLAYSNVFVFAEDPVTGERYVTLHPSLRTHQERTNAVHNAMLHLRSTGTVLTLKGWRNESYGVYVHNRGKSLFAIERSAAPLLGFTRYGCHVNGYCIQPSRDSRSSFVDGTVDQGDLCSNLLLQRLDPSRVMMWLGVRSLTKPTWPGMLDNMAAGGLTFGLDILECARKECREEASVSEELLENLTPVGRLSYIFEDDHGVCPQVEYCFDLELPCDFVPFGADGEVDSFQLVSIDQVKELILSEQFKANSALVVLDFLYRHKFLDPDTDPLHKEMMALMHVEFEFD